MQPIDFANACPDSKVTSLHYHFPWLVKAILRWTVFCAATTRKPRRNLDWAPFFEIADDPSLSFDEKLERQMAAVLEGVRLGRAAREKERIGVRRPLPRRVAAGPDKQALEGLLDDEGGSGGVTAAFARERVVEAHGHARVPGWTAYEAAARQGSPAPVSWVAMRRANRLS